MKIAVCLFGLAGGEIYTDKGIKPVLLADSFNNYQEVLFKGLDVDFFIHSWSEHHKDELLETYKPKKYIIEKQRDFSGFSLSNYSLEHIDSYKKIFNMTHKVKNFLVDENHIFNSRSRWYSTAQSIGLMEDYSASHGVEYDWVMQLRMDLFFRESMPFHLLDKSKFYCCPRFQVDNDLAVNDTWFLSNQKNAKKFSTIYTKVSDYSAWIHAAAFQHIQSTGADIGYFPDPKYRKKNYWMMREVIKEKNAKPLSFKKKLIVSILSKSLNLAKTIKTSLEIAISRIL